MLHILVDEPITSFHIVHFWNEVSRMASLQYKNAPWKINVSMFILTAVDWLRQYQKWLVIFAIVNNSHPFIRLSHVSIIIDLRWYVWTAKSSVWLLLSSSPKVLATVEAASSMQFWMIQHAWMSNSKQNNFVVGFPLLLRMKMIVILCKYKSW